MIPAEIVRTSTFRLTVAFAGTFAISSLLLFLFIYLATAAYEIDRIDTVIAEEIRVVADEQPAQILRAVETRLATDLRRVTFAGLFDARGNRIAGNVATAPAGLPPDGYPRRAEVARLGSPEGALEPVRAVAARLSNGEVLVIGRNVEEIDHLRQVVGRALGLGLIPAVALSLASGAWISRRAQSQVKAVHLAVERIMQGNVGERLPVRRSGDDFDRLAHGVNRMLDQIERLLDDLKGVGDDIAHDLRTPLTRVRTRLERGRDTAADRDELAAVVDSAITGLDQALKVITSLLRIGEIENGRRRAAFGEVDLASLVREIGEFYEPIAEDKRITLDVHVEASAAVQGDYDLLNEAVANLVDNAIKFTPPGGHVRIDLVPNDSGPVIRVTDDGPGVSPEERSAIFQRFYRADKSRRIQGSGLGLSLASAIAALHNFDLSLQESTRGCVFCLKCGRASM